MSPDQGLGGCDMTIREVKMIRGSALSKLIVELYISNLTDLEKGEYLNAIKDGRDPRDFSFWSDIRGLYPKPKLTEKTEPIVELVLREQLAPHKENHERKTI